MGTITDPAVINIVGLTVDPTTNSLWGGTGNTAKQYDLATGVVLSTISLPTTYFWLDLEFDGTSLWAHQASSALVYEVNPTSGTVLQTITVSGTGGIGMSPDTQDIWLFNVFTN